MTYDPRNDWHFDVIKAFHQSLIDDGYPTIDTKRFVMNQVPRIMAELERLKEENKGLLKENEKLKSVVDDVGEYLTEGERSELSESEG